VLTRELTPEEIEVYRRGAIRLLEQTRPQREARQKRGWELAKLAAALLKEEFKVTKVVAFGSLVRKDCFHLWSDVDIAAWGIADRDTFRAIDAVLLLDNEMEINLVDVNCCKPAILASIEKEGVEL